MAIDYRGLEVSPVIGCSIGCELCPQAYAAQSYRRIDSVAPSRYMTYGTFVGCLETVPLGVKVEFAGMAEPWLHPRCTDMLLYAANRGHVVSVFTTLVGLGYKDLFRMQSISYDDFCVHLPDKHGNTKIPLTVEYKDMVRSVLDAGLDVHLGLSISSHGELHPEMAEIVAGRFRVLTETHNRAGNLPVRPGVVDKQVVSRLPGRVRCSNSGSTDPFPERTVLLPDGEVVLCCQDWGMQHVLGNLLKSSYEEILHGVEANRVRAAMDDDSQPLLCRFCTNAVALE